ncbi:MULTISPECIES: ABC transporter substrate-binding protein [unclassified Oceanispirochaeta]|uniref:ABC transporter substrate-binding protein n=1 Tax=unclassified Oceanispirochaeta TaxID=2635722 RepID=UPI001C12FDE3|nr:MULTISPECIES: ABC transporter substrate-binding protein [unclassified Oceanispirochaeta]
MMVKRIGFMLLCTVYAISGLSATGQEEAASETGVSWADEVMLHQEISDDELYELAKAEGKVVIYSMSSRVKKDAFETRYPGVELVVYDMREAEILEKYQREHEAGISSADVIFVKDALGAVQIEFVDRGLLHQYLPADMMATAPEEFQSGSYSPYFEMKQIFYNTEVNDASPVDNWWDLTRPEYSGKIMMRNPLDTATNMNLFLTMTRYHEEMEKAYEVEFGEKLVLNGTENAGYEFIKRLIANDLVLTTSDGDIIDAIGAPGQSNPPIGLVTSSKMRKADEDMLIGVSESMDPRMGNLDPAFLFVADKSEHPNAAKLLIRWMGGEKDGKGEGFAPFHVRGSWPTRADVPTIQTQALDTLNVWDRDPMYSYQNLDTVRNYWLSLQ